MFKSNQFCKLGGIVLVLLILTTNSALTGVISINKLAYQSENHKIREKMNEYPIEYTVIDHYATGEAIIRGTTTSLDPNPLPRPKINANYTHPLSKYQTPLLGGEEIMVLTQEYIPGQIEQNLNYFLDDKEIKDKNWMDDLLVMEKQLFLEPEIAETFLATELAVGDFDGNFQEDLVSISRQPQVSSPSETEIGIQILENWAGLNIVPMAERLNLGSWDEETIPTVVTGDFDGDFKDEFVIIAKKLNQPQIWIYDDLARSALTGSIVYGDKILLKPFDLGYAINSYISSNVSTSSLHRSQVSVSSAPPDCQFTILKASNHSYYGLVEFGDEIVLRDSNGNYWKAPNDWEEGNLFVDSVIDNASKFIIVNNREGNNYSGFVSYHNFISLEDYRGKYVKAAPFNLDIMMSDKTITPDTWFKFVNNETNLMSLTQLSRLDTLNPPNLVKFDSLTRIDPDAYEWHVVSKSIATGDLDGDSLDEIAVVGLDADNWMRAWIFDDAENDFTLLKEFNNWVGEINNINPTVTMGDVNNDTRVEVIFSLANKTYGQIAIYDENWLELHNQINNNLAGEFTKLKTGDIDGDGCHEIIFANGSSFLFIWDCNSTSFTLKDSWSTHASVWEIRAIEGSLPSVDTYIPIDLECGDIDSDGIDEIVFTSCETQAPTLSSGYGVLTAWDNNGIEFEFLQTGFPAFMYKYHGYTPKVVLGDINSDHFTLRYISKDVFTSDEHIIAVMAAPPTQDGISQNYDDSSTEFGEGVSSSSSGSFGLSGSFGAYVSTEWKLDISVGLGLNFKINVAKGETEFTLEAELAATSTVTYTSTEITTYSGDSTQDYIIFSACLYDAFIYEIIESPDPSMLRSNYTINIPSGDRKPDIFQWDLEYYNSRKSDSAPSVGSETFNHTIGYVPSYPNRSEMSKVAPSGWIESRGIQVGKGGGTITAEIDLSKEESIEISAGLLHTGKIGAGNEKYLVGVMWSLGAQAAYSVALGKETMFIGTVGHIQDSDDYANFHYEWGLFIYVKERKPWAFSGLGEALTDPLIVPVVNALSEFISRIGAAATNAILSTDTKILPSGNGYYVLNYWVDIPVYWGEDAQQVMDYASDIDQVISNFETSGLTFLSLIIFLPLIIRFTIYRRKRD
jgi:hypothetical protein